MAKKAAKAAADNADGTPKKMTQIEAVRQIRKLHPKAPPRELAPLLKEKFGIELTPQRISMYGTNLKKRTGKKPGKRGPGKKPGGGSEMTISQLVAAQKAIKDLGGEAKVQRMLEQISAAKKLLANA